MSHACSGQNGRRPDTRHRRAGPPRLAALAAFSLWGLFAAVPLRAADCGGPFGDFLAAMQAEAIALGRDPAAAARFFAPLAQDPAVLRADRRQGVFQLDFITFSRRLISQDRLSKGRANLDRWAAEFDRIDRDYGIPRGILTAFWALETDYGAIQGDFNTANALATLAHDCRRPELFQPQLLAAAELFEAGGFDHSVTGAWAGEIGMVQMLPGDILRNGVDADGDGHVRLKTSVPDALHSGAKVLAHLGWQRDQPWLEEVLVPPTLDWSLSGTARSLSRDDWARHGVTLRSGAALGGAAPASLLLPVGHRGPAFLASENFSVLFQWNQSYTYVLTAAYLGTRLSGAPIYQVGTPEPGLDEAGMKELQSLLLARGHSVGAVDGILGAQTREAVQQVQAQLGLPADGWPTPALLRALRG